MAQKERENFYRNSTVIVDHGKESLSAVLENDLANTKLTFEDFINRHQHDIYHLCYNISRCCQCPGGRFVPANNNRILNPGQLDILLDTSGSTLNGHNSNTSRTAQYCCRPAKKSLSTSNLDITLLRCLLMNFAQNCRTNYILRQDIEDLVKCRNTLYGHAQEARLTDSDYAKYKTDVEGIILRIARFCNIENEMQQKLKDASKRPLDETILIQYQNSLLQQSLYKRQIEETVDQLHQHLTAQDERLDNRMNIIEDKVSEIDYRKRNIIEQAEACLSEHSKDDTYAITQDVKQCYEILERYNALVIFAKAGGGKSKTSLQIAMMYQEKMYTPMLFVNDEIVKKRDLINFNDKNVVIVEDLFGRTNINFNENLHRGILDVLSSCIRSKSCQTKLIMTIRGEEELIRKLIEKHKIFEKEIIINLEKMRNVYCNMSILRKHVDKHGISLCECKLTIDVIGTSVSRTVLRKCSADVFQMNDNSIRICFSFFHDVCCGKYEIQIGFPQACYLFCSNKNFTKQGPVYFTRTSQSLVEEINNLKLEGFDKKQIQYQYCVLVYTAMKRSIDLSDVDEKCLLQILSAVYDECKKLKMLLVKAAVISLEGTYIRKKSSLQERKVYKQTNVSELFILQHNTIQEAILASYGDDVDVLTFCDLSFLIDYIRPKGYTDPLSDNMVLLFTEYEPLAKRLISMVSIDDKASTRVGMYLKDVALLNRHDKLIQFFFESSEDLKPEHYECLMNGLTNYGKNAEFVKLHPKLCSEIIVHSGWRVFLAFCRPIGWVDKDQIFLEIQTELLLKKLYFLIALVEPDDNDKESKQRDSEIYGSYSFSEIAPGRYEVGTYVFKNLIAKGFSDIVLTLFTQLKQNAIGISPTYIKTFLDGLLDDGKRSSIVSQFRDFFEALLFKYGSIPTILQLCRPLTASISSPNIIKVDDKLLIGKLSAFLESSAGYQGISKMSAPVEYRENAYIVYWDELYVEKECIDDVAKFIIEHGFNSNNESFVRLMFEQLVCDEEDDDKLDSSSEDELDSSSDDEKKGDEEDTHAFIHFKKVIYGDYPDDYIRTDKNGDLIFSKYSIGVVKEVYTDNSLSVTTYSRLFRFVIQLKLQLMFTRDNFGS